MGQPEEEADKTKTEAAIESAIEPSEDFPLARSLASRPRSPGRSAPAPVFNPMALQQRNGMVHWPSFSSPAATRWVPALSRPASLPTIFAKAQFPASLRQAQAISRVLAMQLRDWPHVAPTAGRGGWQTRGMPIVLNGARDGGVSIKTKLRALIIEAAVRKTHRPFHRARTSVARSGMCLPCQPPTRAARATDNTAVDIAMLILGTQSAPTRQTHLT